ncbi:MAG TPA: NAD-dependent epimerase/dehydratase family protein, partial [Amycolatopsis sp.]|nr:NAD-dependent epimerase/dehydratase family protein [Amycolatopsis sp.]
GVDRVPFFYYRAKLETERAIEESGLPWTILRTTQFHDLIAAMWSAQKRLPVMFVPGGVRFQPIDVREVAGRLGELAVADARGRVPDLGGPETREARDLARIYLRAVGRRRRLLPVRLPGEAGRAYRAGGNLALEGSVGRITFAEFLRGAEPGGQGHQL